jgi:hypothetical protein
VTSFARILTANGIYSARNTHMRFGLGAETIIACVEIARPSGIMRRARNPGISQVLHITEAAS